MASGDIPWHKRLYAQVIRRAAVDRTLYRRHVLQKLAKIGDAADQWVFGADEPTFTEACEILDIEPSVLRRMVDSLTEEEARALRGLEFEDGVKDFW